MHDVIAALAPHRAGEAIFDMDGTLIENDIGEAALRRVQAMGHRNPRTAGIDDLWAHYRGLGDYLEQCRFAVEALGGLRVRDVEQIVDAAFADGEVAPRPLVCELAHAVARAHRVWILTGSAEVLGRCVAPRLGIRNVLGLRQRIDGDVLGAETLPPTTGDVGKIAATWEWIGRRPVFAIGDSPHDLPLLRLAHVARTTGRIAGVEFPALG